jgi:hypothetical protein
VSATPDVSVARAQSSGSDVWRDLVVLGFAALCIVVAVSAGARYAWMLGHGSSYDFDYLGGWQVVLAKVLVGAAIVLVALAATFATRRVIRSIAGRTPHARAVVLVVLLPGIFLSALFVAPINSVLTWASNHSSEAAAVRAQIRQQVIDLRKAPPQMRSNIPRAPRAVSVRLLSSEALGPSWYDVQHDGAYASVIPPNLAAQGAVQAGGIFITQQHRSSDGWSVDVFVMERITTFANAAEARQYAARYRHSSAATPTFTPGLLHERHLGGVLVRSWVDHLGTAADRSFVFSSGSSAITMSVNPGARDAPPHTSVMRVIRLAVARARD